MDSNTIKNDIHNTRAIVVYSLSNIDNRGNLHDLHNESKKFVDGGIKLPVIYQVCRSLEHIITIEDDKDEVTPNTIVKLDGKEEAKTIMHLFDN